MLLRGTILFFIFLFPLQAQSPESSENTPLFSRALEIITTLPPSKYKTQTLQAFVAILAQEGKPQCAIEVAEKLETPISQVLAKTQIAVSFGGLEKKEKASLWLQKAREQTPTIKRTADKITALTTIAESYTKIGNPEKGIELTEQIGSPLYQLFVFINMAKELVKQKETKTAKLVCQKALKIAEQISYPDHKADALRLIAEPLFACGEKEEANKIFQKAIDTALQIKIVIQKSLALKKIGNSLIQCNKFEKALAVAALIEDKRVQTESLKIILEKMIPLEKNLK